MTEITAETLKTLGFEETSFDTFEYKSFKLTYPDSLAFQMYELRRGSELIGYISSIEQLQNVLNHCR